MTTVNMRSSFTVEVKSGKHYKRHRALGKMLESTEYDIPSAVVFDDDSTSVSGKIFYAPVYMTMFLVKDELTANMIYEIGEPLRV